MTLQVHSTRMDVIKMTVALYWHAGKLPGTTNSKENDPAPGTMQCPQNFHKESQAHSVELNILHVHYHQIKRHKLREILGGGNKGIWNGEIEVEIILFHHIRIWRQETVMTYLNG